MARPYDVAVVGLGATGSQALLALARRGLRVVGLDRFVPPHAHGSSHGRSRIIRQAYYESPAYVPLVRDAWDRWEALARDTGRPLLQQTGGLMLGPADGTLVTGAEASARTHGLAHQRLGAAELRRRFPQFQVGAATEGLHEPMAGILDPEACIAGALGLAARAGATILAKCPLTSISNEPGVLRLATPSGSLEAARVILAAGAWMPRLVRGTVPLAVERQVMWWFRPSAADTWRAGTAPVFLWEWEPGRYFYGIPDQGAGVKVARHHEGPLADADDVDRSIAPAERADIRALAAQYLAGLEPDPADALTCLYTNTPDHDFVLGPVPDEPRVLLASACSGHGFKFASTLGEVLARLACDEPSGFDIAPFAPARFLPQH